MAKYNVQFSCGHEGQVELFGKETERKSKIEYLKNEGICAECYKAKLAKETTNNFNEVEMTYSEYKNKFADCKTKKDSYNANTKTIIVLVKKEA